MTWTGAIPLILDDDTISSQETGERLAKLGAELHDVAGTHGFRVIPAPTTADEALEAVNACKAALAAAESAYAGLTREESQWN